MGLRSRLMLLMTPVCLVCAFVPGWIVVRPTTSMAEVIESVVVAVVLLLLPFLVWWLLTTSLAPLHAITQELDRTTSLDQAAPLPAPRVKELQGFVHSYNSLLARWSRHQELLTGAHIRGQELERRRISRELHDEVGQSLSYLLLLLATTAQRHPDAAADLEEARETIRATLDDVRAISRDLRPGSLETLGLRPALEELSQEHARATNIAVNLDVDHVPALSAEAQIAVYRIVQEALTNVARHAQARNVGVHATTTASGWRLTVDDDGVGITSPAGVGRSGMAERARLIGAHLCFESREPSGTRVSITIPTLEEDHG